MVKLNKSHRQRVAWIILFFIALGVLIIITRWREIGWVLQEADWHPIPGALFFTATSYFFYSDSFAQYCLMLGLKVQRQDAGQICFVTSVLNHIVSSGGIAGYSIRYLLMQRFGVGISEVLTASLVHYCLTSLDMLTMLPISIIYLLWKTKVPTTVEIVLISTTIILALSALLVGLVIFTGKWRTAFFRFLMKLVWRITHRDIRSTLDVYNESMEHGGNVLRQNPAKFGLIMLMTLLDFLSSIMVLGFCFDALGETIPFGALLSGYVIGIMVGVVSMVPGGLGIQEASMAGVFVLFGSNFEHALLASALFRVIYYFLPYFSSLVFYQRLLRLSDTEIILTSPGGKS